MTDLRERSDVLVYSRAPEPLLREAADEIERLLGACKDKAELLKNAYARIDRLRDQLDKAADEIERLRAENEQLKIALSDIPCDDGTVVAVGGEPGASAGKSE